MSKYMEKDTLDKLHKIEIEILDEFVRICEKYKFQYFLVGGTLIGAIRHSGFIPWDDDLDVAMPREDYEKFIKIANTELKDNFFIDNKNTNLKYYLNFTKIRKKGTIFEQDFQVNYNGPKEIWIDVFPIDESKKENSKLLWLQRKLNRLIFDICHYKNGFFIGKRMLIAKKIIGKLVIISNKQLLNIQDKILKLQNGKDYNYWCNLASTYDIKKEIVLKEDYLPAKTTLFEGKKYCIPNNYDKILTKIYGDYMVMPPEEDRVTHNPVKLKF